jgi:DNA-binding PadR family transcriptional regulator
MWTVFAAVRKYHPDATLDDIREYLQSETGRPSPNTGTLLGALQMLEGADLVTYREVTDWAGVNRVYRLTDLGRRTVIPAPVEASSTTTFDPLPKPI